MKRILASFVVLLSVFAFAATSYVEDRTAMLNREYKFKLNKSDIESILRQNERILNLKIERETDVFPANKYPDVKAEPNVFFSQFSIKQEICDSKFPEFHFIITQEKEFTNVKSGSVDFKCKEESIKSDPEGAMRQFQQELTNTFEREVIEKLRQNDSQ